MKEVFYVGKLWNDSLKLIEEGFDTYEDAIVSIDNLPDGTYQIQKVFIKKS